MIVRKILEKTLQSGQTTITFTDSELPNSLIRVYSDDPDLMPVTMSMSGTTLTITYESQGSNKGIAVEMVKSGLEIIDNLTSTDDEAALSAKQGKVLKDLVDGIIPIRNLTALDDVLITNLTDGDILKYDAENEVFKNYLLPDVPVYLGDLGDVVLDTVTQGQVLTYNGAYWINEDPTGGGSSVYSTNEQEVGTWIDGRPVYEKTWSIDNTNTSSWVSIDHNISNFDTVISVVGSYKQSTGNNQTYVMPYYESSTAFGYIAFRSTSLFYRISGGLGVGKLIFTARYLKTV